MAYYRTSWSDNFDGSDDHLERSDDYPGSSQWYQSNRPSDPSTLLKKSYENVDNGMSEILSQIKEAFKEYRETIAEIFNKHLDRIQLSRNQIRKEVDEDEKQGVITDNTATGEEMKPAKVDDEEDEENGEREKKNETGERRVLMEDITGKINKYKKVEVIGEKETGEEGRRMKGSGEKEKRIKERYLPPWSVGHGGYGGSSSSFNGETDTGRFQMPIEEKCWRRLAGKLQGNDTIIRKPNEHSGVEIVASDSFTVELFGGGSGERLGGFKAGFYGSKGGGVKIISGLSDSSLVDGGGSELGFGYGGVKGGYGGVKGSYGDTELQFHVIKIDEEDKSLVEYVSKGRGRFVFVPSHDITNDAARESRPHYTPYLDNGKQITCPSNNILQEIPAFIHTILNNNGPFLIISQPKYSIFVQPHHPIY